MKTTSIFPVHRPASLILMSKYANKLIGDSYDTFPQQDYTSAIELTDNKVATLTCLKSKKTNFFELFAH